MKIDVEAMRRDHDTYRQVMKELAYTGADDVRLLPIREWCGKEFIVVSQIDLRPGYQRIQALEVDDDNLIQHKLAPIARFAGSWCEPIWVEDLKQRRRNAIVIFPDEGNSHVLQEDGDTIQAFWVELVIRVQPGTREDAQRLREEVLEEETADVAYEVAVGTYLAMERVKRQEERG